MNVQSNASLDRLQILIRLIGDTFIEPILGFLQGSFRPCPPPENEEQKRIVTKSAVELAGLIRDRKLSSYQVVKAFFDRICAVNNTVNAVIDGPFADALDEARVIDERLRNNEYSVEDLVAKPFLGVPFTVKDSIEVAGKRHSLGLFVRKNVRGKKDAECVRLMKQSGAIIIGISNVPAINMWVESRNLLFGVTSNPYDLRRTVGGTSGGEAALVTACGTAFGLGTDMGGSIRLPAFNCGVFGHKPSKDVVNLRGCFFRAGKERETLCAAGPIARYAADLRVILSTIADQEILPSLKLNQKVDVKKLRYFYIPNSNKRSATPVSTDAKKVMMRIIKHFSDLTGAPVELARLPGTQISGQLWRYWVAQEPADFGELFGNGAKLLVGLDSQSKSFRNRISEERKKKLRAITFNCGEKLREMLGDDGVLFYHSQPRTTPFHFYSVFKLSDLHYFSFFNLLKVPVTQVPMGLDSNGLPLGIQVVSNDMNDRLCLAVAEELERKFGGWVPPFSKNC